MCNIKNIPNFSRNCPLCKKVLFYSTKYTFQKAIFKNSLCMPCSLKGRKILWGDKISKSSKGKKFSEERCNKISISKLGKTPWNKGKKGMQVAWNKGKKGIQSAWNKGLKSGALSNTHKEKISNALKGRPAHNKGVLQSEEISLKKSEAMRGKNHPMFGKHHSEKTKQKMRESALGKVFPRYNTNACNVIDIYGKENGYNFRHALNGGEFHSIGYSLDGYDKNKNIIIEYYERAHSSEEKTLHDVERKKNLMKHHKCKYIEILWNGKIMITNYNKDII